MKKKFLNVENSFMRRFHCFHKRENVKSSCAACLFENNITNWLVKNKFTNYGITD